MFLVMRSERRKKRFIPILVAGAVGIGAALGWMQTNWRMNGLEQKMQVKGAIDVIVQTAVKYF